MADQEICGNNKCKSQHLTVNPCAIIVDVSRQEHLDDMQEAFSSSVFSHNIGKFLEEDRESLCSLKMYCTFSASSSVLAHHEL